MGFFDSIFGGSSYNNPGWMRRAGRSIFDQYGDMVDDYDPRAVVGQGMEDYDSMLRNSMAARGNNLAADGYRVDGNPTGDIQRARYGSGLWTQARQNALDWRRKLLAERFGMLNGMQDLFGKTYKPGIAGALGGMVGQAATKATGGNPFANQVASAPMTPQPTSGQTSYNYDEGTNQSMGQGVAMPSFGQEPGLSYLQSPSWLQKKRTRRAW